MTFKRYLEIAQTLNKETAVVTDNDGNIEAVKKKYKEYEEIQCIHICVDEVVDTGDLKLSGKDFNYNTLEPKILKENGREAMNNIFGTNYDTEDVYKRQAFNCNDPHHAAGISCRTGRLYFHATSGILL